MLFPIHSQPPVSAGSANLVQPAVTKKTSFPLLFSKQYGLAAIYKALTVFTYNTSI